MEIVCGNYHFDVCKKRISLKELQDICHGLGLAPNEFYLISNGRKISDNVFGKVHIVPRTLGGKGGFGSMLRAIGAQIEKTTNREACRDLSGRRLRDINEEQRLKKWVEQQAEREKEAKERKKKKLEKLLEQPRHEFKDEQYDKERSTLPEKVEDAVLKGLEASCSSMKRKTNDINSKIAKKKPKLWLDSELDEDISSSGSDSEEESHTKEPTSSTQLKSEDSSTTEATKTHIVHKADEEKSSSDTRTSSLDDTTHMSTDILEKSESYIHI